MSHYMTALAMRQVGLKPAAKVVLYWLADHHNERTGACFPSIGRLAELCEMSRRSVEAHLSDLETAGLVQRRPRHRDGGGKASNEYILMLYDGDAQNLRIPPAKSAHTPCAKSAHDITLEDNNLGSERLCMEAACVFEDYNAIAKQAGWPAVQTKSKAREAAAKNRMKECGGYDNWLFAMNRAARSDFLLGKATGTTPASFDWLHKPANFTKLMEGNYDNRTGNVSKHPNADAADRQIAFAAAARRTPSQDCF
jgi:DNA-binding transcriptional ArsR family regulator